MLYCNANDARDIMHAYLRGPDCKKKLDSTCKAHADRIVVLLKYTSKLHGTASPLSWTEKLTILLHTFLVAWIKDYRHIHNGVQENTMIQFMRDHTSCLERQSSRKNKSNKSTGRHPIASNNSNSNCKRNNNNNGNSSNKKKSNPCRISGHDHDWSECPNNRYSKNYKGKNQSKGPKQTGSNGTFQAHMQAAMESYDTNYGGRCERSIDGELVWLP